jgi:hypothetical protein
MAEHPPGRWSRETRLLLLTVAVCAAVLWLLARLRFPDAPAAEVSVPALDRLAARASYDALAEDIRGAEPAIASRILVLRVTAPASAAPRAVREALAGPDAPEGVRHIVAVRTSADTALAPLDASTRIDGIVGGDGSGVASILGIDLVRGWARLRVPPVTAAELPQRPISELATPTYVVVIEGTQAGATLRPVFLGQAARFDSARWTRPLLPLGGIAISPGALLFTLSGEFIGAVVVDGGAPAVVGARDLLEAEARLSAGGPAPVGDLGLAVQRLTPELALATGAPRGVVVSEVDPEGPAAAALQPGDVVTALDGRPSTAPDAFLLSVARRRAGEALVVAFVRAGESKTATLSVRASVTAEAAGTVTFVREAGLGTRIAPGGRGGEPPIAGLQAGDVVTRAADTAAPTPAQLRAAIAGPSPRGFVALVVRRDGRQRLVAVPSAGGGDAAAR